MSGDLVTQKDFDKHERDNVICFDNLFKAQEQNTEAIKLLTENTQGVVQLNQDMQSVVRVGSTVQRFGIFMMKWPIIGVGLFTAYEWIIKHLPG